VPEDVAIGIAFLENGGSETARSVAGAVGIYQLMPGTARSLGLDPSERLNPQKNIEAGLTYLSNNYRRFGDWGLAIWSYHAGEGNVCRAIQIYAESNGVNLGNCLANPADVRNFVAHQGLNVHKLLSRPNVQSRLTNKLNDDSSGYPYKVLATAHLFGLAKNLPHNEFINRIALLNSQNMGLQDFFRS
jgi:soluble lytic murein transglycosylase-like protein